MRPAALPHLVVALVVGDALRVLLVEVEAVLHQELHRLRLHHVLLGAEQRQVVHLAQVGVLGLGERGSTAQGSAPRTHPGLSLAAPSTHPQPRGRPVTLPGSCLKQAMPRDSMERVRAALHTARYRSSMHLRAARP